MVRGTGKGGWGFGVGREIFYLEIGDIGLGVRVGVGRGWGFGWPPYPVKLKKY